MAYERPTTATSTSAPRARVRLAVLAAVLAAAAAASAVATQAVCGGGPTLMREEEMQLSTETKRFVAALKRAGQNGISGPSGCTGEPAGAWEVYRQLREVASEHEFELLLQHRDPAVRAYAAYHRIVDTKRDLSVVAPLIADDAEVHSAEGSLVSTWCLYHVRATELATETKVFRHEASPREMDRFRAFWQRLDGAPGLNAINRQTVAESLETLK